MGEYQKAPQVTRERLYLDAVEEVLGSTSKILMDKDGSNNIMFLPLDKMMSQMTTANTDPNPATSQMFPNASGVASSGLPSNRVDDLRGRSR